MSAREARERFSDIVSRAYYKNEPTIVERQGKPMAVVISPEQYAQLQRQGRQELFEIIRAIHDRNRDADPAEIEAEIDAAVAEVRQDEHADSAARHP
jgi:prevent-host-death family protein